MIRRTQYKLFSGMTAALCLLLYPGMAHAQITVTPTVTQMGSVYHYDYTITNNSADDLFDVSIHVLPDANSVFNVNAPIGFSGSFSILTAPSVGLVDYTEDMPNLFTMGTPISGFVYDSFLAPGSSAFDANSTPDSGLTITSTTASTLAAVPEPGALALLGAIGVASGFALRRRRHNH